MKPKLQDDGVLEKAIGGIPRVARTIVGLPPQERQKALDAVEYSYRETAVELGFGKGQARGWASVVMLSLQAENAGLPSAIVPLRFTSEFQRRFRPLTHPPGSLPLLRPKQVAPSSGIHAAEPPKDRSPKPSTLLH